jgi:hypothetical protein
VGYVNPVSGAVNIGNLRDVPGANANETNTKSFATDESGGVYVVSDYALYRYQVGPAGSPQSTWRVPYDRGTRQKPGQNQQGSGTTPTVFNDFAENQFVAIADNADPFMHVNVYNRQTGALVAQQAVFSAFPDRNACENSLIAVNHSIIIENNYGNADPLSTFGELTTVPGVDRVDFDPVTNQSSVAWDNTTVAIPSVVSQLSTGDGLVSTYAKDHQGWYWAALDYGTGSMVAQKRVPLSDSLGGILANNYYAGIGIGPDGRAYVGTFGGFVAWGPRPPHPDTVGVFDPTTATWYLRNSNSPGAPDITPFAYGAPGWGPVVGDWDGDGITTVGVFDPVGQFGQPPATWYLRNSNAPGAPDIAPFAYGGAQWQPVAGDWDGDGITTVGVVDPLETWYERNENSPGAPDVTPFAYGAPGWPAVTGDWKRLA